MSKLKANGIFFPLSVGHVIDIPMNCLLNNFLKNGKQNRNCKENRANAKKKQTSFSVEALSGAVLVGSPGEGAGWGRRAVVPRADPGWVLRVQLSEVRPTVQEREWGTQ